MLLSEFTLPACYELLMHLPWDELINPYKFLTSPNPLAVATTGKDRLLLENWLDVV